MMRLAFVEKQLFDLGLSGILKSNDLMRCRLSPAEHRLVK